MSKKILYTNGLFHTGDPQDPAAQALAVDDGRIIELGTNAKLRPLAKRGFSIVDLKKRRVIPGMIDSHLHLLSLGFSFKRVNLDGIDSPKKVETILQSAAAKLSRGQWLLGRGWNKNLWGDDFPDKKLLDRVTSHPVALSSKDGHLVWVNSAALKFGGIDGRTPDPPGGVIVKDEFGEPTGILKETAADNFLDMIPKPTYRDKMDAIRAAQKHLLKLGIIGVGDCDGDEDQFRIYDELDQKRRLYLRIFKMIPKGGYQQAVDSGLRTGRGGEHFRKGCLKLFADGALGSQTAFMFEPYENSLGNSGVQTLTPEEMNYLISRAIDAGISVAIHAIGDRANYQTLCALGKYHAEFRRKGLRPRIEHAQILRKADIQLFRHYGIIASAQPIHATSDRDIADRYWGKRARYAYPFKTFLDSGIRLAFGSDAPIETANPLAGIHAAVTRQRSDEKREAWYPEEKISLEGAVEAYTAGAAIACCYEDITGTLTPGKRADFAVLSDDIFKINPARIADTEVVMTVIDGKIVHEK